MKILLDTHALLWWLMDDARLSEVARAHIRDPANIVLVSSATGWEIATKMRLGKLEIRDWSPADLPATLGREQMEILPIGLEHALGAGSLEGAHRDPFDRMLIAQSRAENVPVVTKDPVFAAYGVDVIW